MLYELPFRIAEQGEEEIELLHHRSVAARGVYAYGCEPRPAFVELFVIPGVADQLPIAVRSPVSPVEDQDEWSLFELLREVEGPSLLVW